jgi:CRP-like cAMP-binding protein
VRRSGIGADGAERLRRIPLFEDLSPGQRRMLARLVDQVSVAAGEEIFEQGAPGHEFIVLEQGSAEVFQDGVRINVLGPGDFFGELAVLRDGSARTAKVVTSSDVCALVFTAHFFHEARERLPQLAQPIDRAAKERLELDAGRA